MDSGTNDVRTEFHGCSLWLKIFAIQLFDPYKKPNGGEGRGGRNQTFPAGKMSRFLACKAKFRQNTGRMPQAKVCGGMNAVPSPGHKKTKKIKLN